MSISLLTRADAVEAAMDEYDELGRQAFLDRYGFGPSRRYFLVRDGRRYDSKAIAGAAVGKEHPSRGALRAGEFSGGEDTVCAKLESLGFKVLREKASTIVEVESSDMEIDKAAFEDMAREFSMHLEDFEAFDPPMGQYLRDERAYKDEFFEIFRSQVGPLLEREDFDEEASSEVIAAILGALTHPLNDNYQRRPQQMIPWRGFDHLRNLETSQKVEAAQTYRILWSDSMTPAERMEQFCKRYVAFLEEMELQSAIGTARLLGSLILAVKSPKDAIFIRPRLWGKVTSKLLGRRIILNQPTSESEYNEALTLAHAVSRMLSEHGWKPVDFWDVHNFFWVVLEWPSPDESGDGDADDDEVPPDEAPPAIDIEDIAAIAAEIARKDLLFDLETIERYHLGLRTRNFVILAGDSGTGKTLLAVTYAEVIGAEFEVAPVAPNWTSNEDLLGFHNPIDGAYRHTATSRFLERASRAFTDAQQGGERARQFHLVLDEMNLARVEHYFARFLSAMERRDRDGVFEIELEPDKRMRLGPNFYVIGTVNVDETTHGFSDKVYDRAQLIEIDPSKTLIAERLNGKPYGEMLMGLWQHARGIAPFAFRTLEDIDRYVALGKRSGMTWEKCLDHQIRQKVLPKAKGADPRVKEFLAYCVEQLDSERFPLSHAKAQAMLHQYQTHGYASYF